MPEQIELGKLEKVDVRSIWKKEATDFTKWLAKEENLSKLGDEIGITMQLVQTEASVGPFSADILAKEDKTDKPIIIENQLGQTDHDHFGKLFTYGSGFDAGILIWVCTEIRDEHRQAIDWLNEKTTTTLQLFLIKMEAWKIGNSLPAPKFQIICSPNDWAKNVKESGSGNKLSEINILQQDFWNDFNSFVQKNKSSLKTRKAQPQHWYDVSIENIPTSQAYLSFTVSFSKNFIRCEFYIPNNKQLYLALFQHKAEIENELGFSLVWEESPMAKASGAYVKKENLNLKNKETWPSAEKWFLEMAAKFATVFPKYYDPPLL